jgi:hypothetical protein
MICNTLYNYAHAQSRLEAEYAASVAGIPVGDGVWVVTINDKEYTAEASGRVTGLLSLITSGEGSIAARGTVSHGLLSATNYSANVKYSVAAKSKKFTTVRMELNSRTVKHLVLEPSNPPSKKNIPVTEEDRRGIIDPMTASLIPVAGAGEILTPGACEQTLPVFDGTHRFNLVLSFKRMEEVQADKGYRGPAVVCGVNYLPVAGYNPNRFAIKYLMTSRDIEIWLTPITGTHILAPFRISVPTTIGIGVLQAKQFVAVAQEPRTPTAR